MSAWNKKRILPVITKLFRDLNLVEEYYGSSMEFKIVVQKLCYLIQKIGGLDFGLKFEWLSRGPYSRSLQNYYHAMLQYLSHSSNDTSLNEAESLAISKVEDFLNTIKAALGALNVEILEAAASLIMLCSDVYPVPEDPVNELLKRKGLSKEFVLRIFEVIKGYGICT
uniref:Uncharacterized protein n=1 Tax=Ignisphaera aggregans TaxID=334771 RepID=A0A7J3YUQ2_9CREN